MKIPLTDGEIKLLNRKISDYNYSLAPLATLLIRQRIHAYIRRNKKGEIALDTVTHYLDLDLSKVESKFEQFRLK